MMYRKHYRCQQRDWVLGVLQITSPSSMAHASLALHVRQLFQSEEAADCVLRFYRTQPRGPPNNMNDPAWLGAPIPAHTIVLAASSLRLAMQVKNWGRTDKAHGQRRSSAALLLAAAAAAAAAEAIAETATPHLAKKLRLSFRGQVVSSAAPTPPPTAAGRGEPFSRAWGNAPLMLAVPLDGPHELQPAMHVLEYMYTDQLPAASSLQLLQIRKQAQYLLCAPCAAACASAASAAAITLKDAVEVYSEPGAMQDSALSQLIESCWTAAVGQLRTGGSGPDDAGMLEVLLARLGSTLLEVMGSPGLQKLWLALPITALQMLLSSSDSRMMIDCEESVLLLLHRWVTHAADRAQHGKQLRKLFSPLDLGPAYVRHVLPKLT